MMSCQIRQFINSHTSNKEVLRCLPSLSPFCTLLWRWREMSIMEDPTSQEVSLWSFYSEDLQEKTKHFSWTQPALQVCGCGLRLQSWTTALFSTNLQQAWGRGQGSSDSCGRWILSSSRTYSIISITSKLCVVPTPFNSVLCKDIVCTFPF